MYSLSSLTTPPSATTALGGGPGYGTRVQYPVFPALKGWAKLLRPAVRDSRVVIPISNASKRFQEHPEILKKGAVLGSPLPRDLACFRMLRMILTGIPKPRRFYRGPQQTPGATEERQPEGPVNST